MKRVFLIPVVLLVVAGCTTNQTHDMGAMDTLDTGDIVPSSTRALVFDAPDSLLIHCHPHPWMRQNVTITQDAPTEAHVDILDGLDEGDFRYEPANLTIGAGSRVTYHNHGTFTHTATQKTDDAPAMH